MPCEICGVDAVLVRDHDHKTGMIRGMLCDPCNGRLGVYEKKKAAKSKCYKVWVATYEDVIKAFLGKSTGLLYVRRANRFDSVTGFSLGQMKQQARSTKSEYGDQSRKRLTELGVAF